MKKILGLDLGTTSIGWALVNEAEKENEISSIIKTGVRVVPLSTDEQISFEKGQSITINADRTLKRGMRRNLQRYKQRRNAVVEIFKKINWITEQSVFAESGKETTFSTHALRAKAPTEKLEKEDLVRVFLMINKKRGYKSSRKANNAEEGQLIDGMAIAKRLHKEKLSPGQLSYILIKEGKKLLPSYYRSDLQDEFNNIWDFQSKFYPEALTETHKDAILKLKKVATGQYFEKVIKTPRAETKGKRDEKKLQFYHWRNTALNDKLSLPEVAFILTEINGDINNSSGYLGAISDRSKELYFNNQTVGQYQYEKLKNDAHASLRNNVFYRQDYMDEFDAIWKEQSKHYKELSDDIKNDLRNITIFYQRKLKSQKGLINICELEGRERSIIFNGERKLKYIGPRVAPKSSPVFQHSKIWQNINNIQLKNEVTKEIVSLDDELKSLLFNELNITENFSKSQLLKFLKNNADITDKNWKVNLEKIEGNNTNASLVKAYDEILEIEGYEPLGGKVNALERLEQWEVCFKEIGIDTAILHIDYSLTENDFAKQPAYELWHLLYSYEDDNSPTGTVSLENKLEKFGFEPDHTSLLIHITFQQNYGNLSVKALRKLLPHLEDGKMYSEAANAAGYNHSKASITKEENDKRNLALKLNILPKNALRNPVVEKILNQMINVINAIIDDPTLGKLDEIRIELARELKKTAKQRGEMTQQIATATKEHEKYRTHIKNEFGLKYVSRKDLIKYKLYLELKATGFKTLYSGTYIKPEDLFTPMFDVEHIIPQSVQFDDSFSNKTLELRTVNLEKGNETAIAYCERKGWAENYKQRIEQCYNKGKGNLKFSKRKKLLTNKEDLSDGFLNRDLGNSAFIARKAIEITKQVVRNVYSTSGTITSKLRSDWELINVLQELNWDKYHTLGLTYYQTNKEGRQLPRIKDWSKRNDHRHHAMDAITVAFTKPAFVQYLNNMNAKTDNTKEGNLIFGIEKKYTYRDKEGGRKFNKPYESIREDCKAHLEKLLISHKTKNKVVTNNKNKIKLKGKRNYSTKIELTPRGQLHKETIYGKSKSYEVKEEKVNASFNEAKINTVTRLVYKKALLERLKQYGNDSKKAFTGKNSLSKNPIIINGNELPEKITTQHLKEQFTIRKEITPDLKVDKVIDEGVKRILKAHLNQFDQKPKLAFANLDENPIWLNKEKGIAIKSVTITGVNKATPLHVAKNHLGQEIVDKQNQKTDVDYVSTGNNHHVAIYKDDKGNLHEEVVSFYEAVTRRNLDIPIIKKNHENAWEFLFTMKQNELFVFPNEDFNPTEIDLLDEANLTLIHKNLFRVQKISTKNYVFNHHLETLAVTGDTLKNKKELSDITYKSCRSEKSLNGIVKIRLNHLGKIVHVGEY